MKYYILYIFILLVLFSCEKETAINSYSIETEPFDSIEINNPFDIYLMESSDYYIEVRGAEDIINDIRFKVENNTLTIDNLSKNNWLSPTNNIVELTIHSGTLSKVSANETCNIQTINAITSDEFGLILKSKANQANLNLDCGTFYYWNNTPCGGLLTLNGRTENLKIWNYALMTVDAKELITSNAIIENSSIGDCTVNVQNKMEYGIYGPGDIHLYGVPSIIIQYDITSTGKLIIH